MLKNFLMEDAEIPWEALKFMTGNINYGGNVTDDFDRILLLNILNIFQNDEIVSIPNFKFSRSGVYACPEHERIDQIRAYIERLPNIDDPEIFGMHQNANIAYLRAESAKVLETVLNVQPRESAETGADSEEKQLLDLIAKLQLQVPEPIRKDMFAKEIMKLNAQGLPHCFSTVLFQEVARYNNLLARISSSLQMLNDAAQGKTNMSSVLDAMHTALMKNKVPDNWSQVAYPSLKPLASWMLDLGERVNFMKNWASHGHPASYWLAGFFFPHGFITGVLQLFARKHSYPIDLLYFDFNVLGEETRVSHPPSDGVYIYGLFIENAKWSAADGCLVEPEPGEMHSQVPIVHFIPRFRRPKTSKDRAGSIKMKSTEEEEDETEVFKCPVYKTSARAGVLSTTGMSTNFILTVDLPCGVPDTQEQKLKRAAGLEISEHSVDSGIIQFASPEFWTLRGAALLTMLDN